MVMCISLLGVMVSPKIIVKADGAISNPRISEDGTVTWDVVRFGNYYQDAQIETEAIKWRILSINDDGTALLLADKVIDCNSFNLSSEDVTWKDCSLRKWLNDYFYNTAFTSEEQGLINNTLVMNENLSGFDVDSGEDTIDKVFVLSMSDVQDNKYGLYWNTATKANYTDFAKMNGLNISKDSYENNSSWWLRTIGCRNNEAAFIDRYGDCDNSGCVVSTANVGVRPVLQINLNDELISDAGTVTSNGEETGGSNRKSNEYSNPIIDQQFNKVTWDCLYFGKYKQSVQWEKQPLEWRVLSVDGENALLLADKVVDFKSFGELWDNEKFVNDAFTEDEQNAIKHISIDEDKIIIDDTSEEMVFLLSRAEMLNTAYGFEGSKISRARQAKATDYARFQGTTCNDDGYCEWVLREEISDDYNNLMDIVSNNGDIVTTSVSCNLSAWNSPIQYIKSSVRPAIYVNINSEYIKPLKTVTSTVDLNNQLYQLDGKRYYNITYSSKEGYLCYYGSEKVNDEGLYHIVEKGGTAEDKTITRKQEAGILNNRDVWGGDYEKYGLYGWKKDGEDTVYVLNNSNLKTGEKSIKELIINKDITLEAVWIEKGDPTSTTQVNDNKSDSDNPINNDSKDIDKENKDANDLDKQGDKDIAANQSGDSNTSQSSDIEKQNGYAIGEAVTDKDNKYTVDSEDTVIYEDSDNDAATSVIIPDTVVLNGKLYKVTKISDGAFSKNTSLKKVAIGSNIETIGAKAFSGCSNLTSISMNGNSLKTIEAGAFENCKKLSRITLGKNVVSIGKNAFKGDKKLRTITIKSTKIKTIGKNAFKNINNKAKIYVPKSLSKKQFAKYKKMLKKAGFPKTVKIKKK